ncbi:unnamed protein product, partial [Acanthoscelides obtectus]
KKIIAKPPLLYSTLNPDTNSDSPSAKSKGVRLVSAKLETNHIKDKGVENKQLKEPRSTLVEWNGIKEKRKHFSAVLLYIKCNESPRIRATRGEATCHVRCMRNIMPPSNLICTCCNKSFKLNMMIKCTVCMKAFRHLCVNLTIDEVNILNDQSKGYSWSCSSCRNINNQINDLKKLILSLQDDIKAIKGGNGATTHDPKDSFVFEELIEEINDRNSRKRNVIIFGLPEQDQADVPQTRLTKDKSQVVDVLKVINLNVHANEVKPLRLGRFDQSKCRPIKLSLKDEDEVINVIRNAKNLKNSTFNRVSISFDRTRKQIDHYKALQEELAVRNSEGSQKFKIKYINGTPKSLRSSCKELYSLAALKEKLLVKIAVV